MKNKLSSNIINWYRHYLTIDFIIKILFLIILILVVNILFDEYIGIKSVKKIATIDLIAINDKYAVGALELVLNIKNQNLSQDEKFKIASRVTTIYQKNIDKIITDTANKHKVILIQAQTLASDNMNIPDYTREVEQRIDKLIKTNTVDNGTK